MLKLAEDSVAKNLKVGVGLMSRHARALQELAKRIEDGEIGDVILLRGYRMAGQVGSAFSTKWPGHPSELLWQIRRFHSFIWASGGCYNDFYIHHIDHLCWMKNAWPIKAQALGGKHYKTSPEGEPFVDQNFDSYAVEYTFADGAKMIPGQQDPYQNEWDELIQAIRNDKPYNEVKRGVEASITSNMGRMAAHTGQEITFEDARDSEHEMAPGVEKFTMESAAPLVADKGGKYPVPMPGIKKTEY
jgi:hypothetical protein